MSKKANHQKNRENSTIEGRIPQPLTFTASESPRAKRALAVGVGQGR